MKPSIFNYIVHNLRQEKKNNVDSKAYQLSVIHNSDKQHLDVDIENELKGITKTWSRCTVKCNK